MWRGFVLTIEAYVIIYMYVYIYSFKKFIIEEK